MSSWFLERHKRVSSESTWLAVNSWRQVWRRRVSLPVLRSAALVVLAVYGVVMCAVTNGMLAVFRGLELGQAGGIWFGLGVYGLVVPVMTAILALSFRPLFAEPSEAVAAVPVSVKEWYGSQIMRFGVGVAAVLVATWTAVTWALVRNLDLSWTAGLTLEAVALAANGVAVALLLVVVTRAVLGPDKRLNRWLPLGLVVLMAGALVYVHSQQETGLRQWAGWVAAHLLASGAIAIGIGLLAGLVTVVVVKRELMRKAEVPLGLPVEARLSNWRQRSLPMPRALILQLMVITLRGLAVDRKNAAMLVSSLALFLAFGVAARAMHNPSLNSLVLGASAVYVPLFLSLITIFGRSMLGRNQQSVYTRPVGIWSVAGGQFTAMAGLSVVVTVGFVTLIPLVVGNRIVLGELMDLAANAAISSGIAWVCGSLLRVTPRDNLGILAGVIGMVVIQGSYYALASKLGDRELLAGGFKLLVLLGLCGVGAVAEYGYSGRRWIYG